MIRKLTFDSGTFVLVDKGGSMESPIFVNVLCASSMCASSSASCLARFYHNLVQRKIQDHHNFDYLAFLGHGSVDIGESPASRKILSFPHRVCQSEKIDSHVKHYSY